MKENGSHSRRFASLAIDKNSPEPAYRQLADNISRMIDEGGLVIGEQLPTVDELSEITHLSRMTVQRAIQVLQAKKCVSARRGRGAFVVARETHLKNRVSVGFIVRPRRDPNFDPFYSEILHGVAEEARKRRVDLAFALGEAEIEAELAESGFPLAGKATALLLAGHMPDPILQFLHRARIPHVLIDAKPARFPCDAVATDNEKTGRLMGGHLRGLGHRKILYINGLEEVVPYRDRFRGFEDAFSDCGGARIHEISGAQMAEDGRRIVREAIEGGLEFTAVAGCNDMVAIGAMNELRDMNRRVPDEIGVCGFNDIPFAAESRPALTTVRIPKREMGARAVGLALRRLENPGAVFETVLLDVSLVERQSTAPPPYR